MRKLVIDGREIEVQDGITLIQACEEAGIEIPRFCYHERLSIAGNCRMCLVEVVGMPKPTASCAMSVNDLRPGMKGEPPEIKTHSEIVKKAREGVLEFLLINHPLDCPICDQGGECDLQDQAMAYGIDSSRYVLNKRAVEDKNIGPLIKTIMTRCIHCTRCVRFMTEVAGVEELGAIGRGEDMEITTYLERGMTSELSGNVIDLCPVGALTSKPYAFSARPWELQKTESIDVMDAVGSNIRVDTRGPEVMRILPRNHDGVNEEWISDKTRFIWDGLRTQRLDQPYIRQGGRLVPASWEQAFSAIKDHLMHEPTDRAAAILGDMASVEELFAFKGLAGRLGWTNIDCRQDGATNEPSWGRATYLFNSSIEGIDRTDAILLIGANPRYEASVVNARIRTNWKSRQFKIGLIGEQTDLTYGYEYLGAGPGTLKDLIDGKIDFVETLKNAESPMVIIGQSVLRRKDSKAVLSNAAKLAVITGMINPDAEWNGFNVLPIAASRVGALDLGLVPDQPGKGLEDILDDAENGAIDFVYLLGADDFDVDRLAETFVVYQGSHGDRAAQIADVILPGAAYTEKQATYVNIEGRVQTTSRAVFPPGIAKEDWAILRALSAHLDHKLPYDSLQELRKSLYEAHPHFASFDTVEPAGFKDIEELAKSGERMRSQPFDLAIDDFYLTNPIARASAVMAELSALSMVNRKIEATGTNG